MNKNDIFIILGVFSSKEVNNLLNLSKMTKEEIRTLMGGNFIIEAKY